MNKSFGALPSSSQHQIISERQHAQRVTIVTKGKIWMWCFLPISLSLSLSFSLSPEADSGSANRGCACLSIVLLADIISCFFCLPSSCREASLFCSLSLSFSAGVGGQFCTDVESISASAAAAAAAAAAH